jgi:hypothetical protein
VLGDVGQVAGKAVAQFAGGIAVDLGSQSLGGLTPAVSPQVRLGWMLGGLSLRIDAHLRRHGFIIGRSPRRG